MGKTKIVKGSTVEYLSVLGKVQVTVLKVKPNGDLILDTAKLGLCRNVCVLQHRVKLIS